MQNNPTKPAYDLYGESKEFAFQSVKLYQHLTQYAKPKEKILSGQYLLAATRIGDLVRQEQPLEAYHMARSAHYWLQVLQAGGYLAEDKAAPFLEKADHLTRYLYVVSHPEARKDKDASAAASVPEFSPSGVNPFAKKGGAL